MADILLVGAGVNGLSAALLLARDGHAVTMLERDPAPPQEPGRAWDDWDRHGCSQFRLPHYLLPRFRRELDDLLPDVAAALVAAGAVEYDVIDALPTDRVGGRRPGDERFRTLTARRPVLEAVLSARVADQSGIDVRRGCSVRSLTVGASDEPGVPHVTGVVTDTGERIVADLVVDAGGRRSSTVDRLTGIGATSGPREPAPTGTTYFARHFTGDALPPLYGPVHQQHDSLSILTLPADNHTWSVVACVAARDHALRGLRSTDTWTDVVRSYPLAAPWIDATPITDVVTMGGLTDQLQAMDVDGDPTVTGLVLLGDAWACTDPSLGRGTSIGLIHVRALCETLRKAGFDRPGAVVREVAERTRDTAEPWHRATVAAGRSRLLEITSDRNGQDPDPSTAASHALRSAAGRDPEALRAALDIASMLEQPADVLRRPGLLERITEIADGAPRYGLPGPTRASLLATAGS